jgi:hypothetical protein
LTSGIKPELPDTPRAYGECSMTVPQSCVAVPNPVTPRDWLAPGPLATLSLAAWEAEKPG